MKKIDVNCLYGNWPFRKLHQSGMERMQEMHRRHGFEPGCISSLDSIFYVDPMEAEEPLCEAIRSTGYRQIFTVNPTFPGAARDIREAAAHMGIAGVRITPGYHGYRLDDPCLTSLRDVLLETGLPLYVMLRLEDVRLNYLITPRTVEGEELKAFPAMMKGVKILYTNITAGEAIAIAPALRQEENVFVECSMFKPSVGSVRKVIDAIGKEKILFGSAYPFYCFESSLIEIENSNLTAAEQEAILYQNACRFFER